MTTTQTANRQRMEDRIRFVSDGNGIAVFVNTSALQRPRWTAYDSAKLLRQDWEHGRLRRVITVADFNDALRHFGGGE